MIINTYEVLNLINIYLYYYHFYYYYNLINTKYYVLIFI